jgi:hypothetical protein
MLINEIPLSSFGR